MVCSVPLVRQYAYCLTRRFFCVSEKWKSYTVRRHFAMIDVHHCWAPIRTKLESIVCRVWGWPDNLRFVRSEWSPKGIQSGKNLSSPRNKPIIAIRTRVAGEHIFGELFSFCLYLFIFLSHIPRALTPSGEQVFQIGTHAAATFVLSWHPKQYLLSYSSEAKYDQGVIRLFGLSSDGSRPADSIWPRVYSWFRWHADALARTRPSAVNCYCVYWLSSFFYA